MIFLYLLFTISSVQAQLRVAVVDTGLDLKDNRFTFNLCKDGHADFTDTGMIDHNDHGTFIAGLIKKTAGKSDYCLIIIKYFDNYDDDHLKSCERAIQYAASLNPDIVNLSISGPHYSAIEKKAIKDHPNTKFIIAAGNEGHNLDDSDNYVYPACYNLDNIIVVGNGIDGKPSTTSNYGKIVKVWINGDNIISTVPNGFMGMMGGTSMSTAIETGRLIRELSK